MPSRQAVLTRPTVTPILTDWLNSPKCTTQYPRDYKSSEIAFCASVWTRQPSLKIPRQSKYPFSDLVEFENFLGGASAPTVRVHNKIAQFNFCQRLAVALCWQSTRSLNTFNLQTFALSLTERSKPIIAAVLYTRCPGGLS
jgi:hypothetical protein